MAVLVAAPWVQFIYSWSHYEGLMDGRARIMEDNRGRGMAGGGVVKYTR